jgi:hypothetical protein
MNYTPASCTTRAVIIAEKSPHSHHYCEVVSVPDFCTGVIPPPPHHPQGKAQ